MRRAGCLLLAIAITTIGCRGDRKPHESPSSRPGSSARVSIWLDDQRIRDVALDPHARVDLATLLPPHAGTPSIWRDVVAHAPPGRMAIVQRPTESYAGQRAELYLEGGQPRFGMFRTVDPSLPDAVRALGSAPTVSLVGVTEVHVRTRERAPAPPAHAVSITINGRPARQWTHEDLQKLPLVKPPGTRSRQPAWNLGAAVRDELQGKRVRSVRLVGRDPASMTLDARQLADRTLLLKLNRRGEARLRIWAREGGDPVGEIRDLAAIEVLID